MTDSDQLLARDERLAALFPDDHAPVDGSRRNRRRFRNLALAAAVVVAVVVVIAASSAFGSGTDRYRTAVVTEHRVTATIDGVATIEPVNQVQVGFPTSGTVATVAVKPGDPVTIGQTLATLDETSLTAALHDKEAALANANLTLHQARNGQLSQGAQRGGVSTASTGSSQSAAAAESTDIVLTAAMTPSGPSDQDIAAAQQAVIERATRRRCRARCRRCCAPGRDRGVHPGGIDAGRRHRMCDRPPGCARRATGDRDRPIDPREGVHASRRPPRPAGHGTRRRDLGRLGQQRWWWLRRRRTPVFGGIRRCFRRVGGVGGRPRQVSAGR